MVTRGHDRGQLILIGAVLVALTIVASVVLLNSVHASADVRAQQDQQNLEQAERVTDQIKNDVRELFIDNGSEKAVGDGRYIVDGNESQFAALVDEYNGQYLNISSTTQSGFVNVTFNESHSARGDVVYQNETDSLGGWTLHAGSPVRLSYLYINVTDVSSARVQIGGAANAIEITGSGPYDVVVDGVTKCNTDIGPSQPLEIDLARGVGRITGASCDVTVDLSAEFLSPNGVVQFSPSSSLDGTATAIFEGTASPGSLGDDDRGREADAVVYPNFHIVYEDPSVAYEANVTLYEGDS